MLGAMHGFYDTNDWKCCSYVDTILDCWVDMHDKSYEVAMFMPKATEEEKATKMQEYIEKFHEPCLGLMEKLLERHGGPYIAGPKVTIADIAMVAFLLSIWECEGGPFTETFKPVLAKYPKVQAYNLKLRETFSETIKSVNAPKRCEDTFIEFTAYFTVPDGKYDELQVRMKDLYDLTKKEPKCVFYGYTYADDKKSGMSREAYADAEGQAHHITNVMPTLMAMMKDGLIKMERTNVSGPANELAKLKEPFKNMNVTYYNTVPGGIWCK